jgi:hypothetical protein
MRFLTLTLVSVLLFAGMIAADDEVKPLPAFRDIWLDTKELPNGLGEGSWSIVPRTLYEETAARARAMDQALRRPPWLIEAKYSARFTPHQLTGTAELALHNPHSLPTVARLSPWTLTPTSGNRLVGLGERNLGIEVAPSTTMKHSVSWTAQGELRQDGSWFTVQLPGCALSSFEVTVPFPYRLDWPGGRQYLDGPYPVPDSLDRRWRLTLGGTNRHEIQLVIRAGAGSGQGMWTEARLDADFVVHDTSVRARYEVDLQRWQGRLSTLALETPPDFSVSTVTLRQAGTETPLPWAITAPRVLQLTFPEAVEQRAVFVLEGTLPVGGDGKVKFDLPELRGVNTLRPTLRIARPGAARPLVDWAWGDFQANLSTEAARPVPAEMVTLLLHALVTEGKPRPPSARLSPRQEQLQYIQHTWAHWERSGWAVTVRCQCTVPDGQAETLAWHVPPGWQVKEVTPSSKSELKLWTQEPGGPLLFEAVTSWRPGTPLDVTVHLEPTAVHAVTRQSMTFTLPHLVPVIPGKLTGTYAITLARPGGIQPPGVTIVKAPGPLAFPSPDSPDLWSGVATAPDFYWQLAQPAVGELLLQDWDPSARITLLTALTAAREVRYHVNIRPVAGETSRLPLRFSGPVPRLTWRSSKPLGLMPRWEIKSPQEGVLVWPEPVTQPLVLESSMPWEEGQPIPLLSASGSETVLQLPAQFQPQAGHTLTELRSSRTAPGQGTRWCYTPDTLSVRVAPVTSKQGSLREARLVTRVRGRTAEHDFSMELPPRSSRITFLLPEEATGVHIDAGGERENPRSVVVPAFPQPSFVRFRYQTQVFGGFGVSWTAPAAPTVEPNHHINIRQEWHFPTDIVPGVFQHARSEADGRTFRTEGDSGSWWVEEDLLRSIGLLGCCLLMPITYRLARVWVVVMLVLLGLAAFLLPAAWLILPAWWAVGLVPAATPLRSWLARRRRSRRVAVCVVLLLAPWTVLGQVREGQALVYLFPGDRRPAEDRAVVPTFLWTQLRHLAELDLAGLPGHIVIEEATCQGEVSEQRLRLTSTWAVHVRTEGPVDLPWRGPSSVIKATLDGEPLQPSLLPPGPFGLRQLNLRLSGRGRHVLRVTSETPVRRANMLNVLDLALPGAPVQTLHLTFDQNVAGVHVTGSTGARTMSGKTLRADVGLAKALSVSWFSAQLVAPDAEARVGVLWEHRIHESVARAVIRYQIEQGALGLLELDLPAGLRVRTVNLIGDVPAPAPARVASWKLEPRGQLQRLTIQLQRPITGVAHLLLELPWDRRNGGDTVPLSGIWPANVSTAGGFVAFWAEGVRAETSQPLVPPALRDLDFARPWLPSLNLIPISTLTALLPPHDVPPSIRLRPLPKPPVMSTLEIILGENEVSYRFQADIPRPAVCLTAQVDDGLRISEVQGRAMHRWHVTPQPTPGQPGRLEVWLRAREVAEAEPVTLTVIAQPIREAPVSEQLSLPLSRLRWDHAPAMTSLTVYSAQGNLVEAIQPPLNLTPRRGPWPDPAVIAEYLLPADLPTGQSLTVHVRTKKQPSSPVAELRRDVESFVWTVAVGGGTTTLGPGLEILVLNGRLEDEWSFQADVPVAAVPRRDGAGHLVWNVQFAKPAARLTIRSRTGMSSAAATQPPTVSILQMPGLTWKSLPVQ